MSSGAYRSVDGLVVEQDGGVLRVTLDRPDARNSMNDEMVEVVIEALEAAGQDETVRAIALGSSGDHFCAGADVVARNAPDGQRPRVGSIQRRVPVKAHRLVPLLLSTQVPVVCTVRGWAAGLGFHLALASDFCLASQSARFWEPFITRGFTPDSGGTWLVPRLAGVARARELLLLGRELSGEEAADWGLIHRAHEDSELDGAAQALVQRLAAGPTVAVGLTKWLLHAGSALDLDHQLANEAFALELSSRTADFREGLSAFREKRNPDFEGR